MPVMFLSRRILRFHCFRPLSPMAKVHFALRPLFRCRFRGRQCHGADAYRAARTGAQAYRLPMTRWDTLTMIMLRAIAIFSRYASKRAIYD